ncbi:MAG: TIGR03663 family protein [Phycisphaerae bacterium]|nr:TIGR03663 family protein [Phycisphaerae bacterium]
MRKSRVLIFVVAVMIVAGGLRFARLSQRPLHTDEAVHAEKFRELLEQGTYTYDPFEYHGPTLNYLTLVLARLRGQATYQAITEWTLRAGPALMGMLLILMPLGLWGLVDKRVIGLTMVFIAVSPAMVFYSRYYIQETFLVCFTAGLLVSVLQYLHKPHWAWAVMTGVCVGLMHATKETCVIAFFAVCAAVFFTRVKGKRIRISWSHAALCLGSGALVSVACFSSFFTQWQGVWDSVATYAVYFGRAGHEGANHHHHWFYYLDLLTWVEFLEWPGWNEDYTVIGAFLGIWWVFRQEIRSQTQARTLRCVALFTLVTLVVYSLIPYKTPWCMLTFLYGMLVLAAFATVELAAWLADRQERVVLWTLLIVMGVISPLGQAVAENFVYETDTTNPYVYGHTHKDIFALSDELHALVRHAPQGRKPVIQVVCPGKDYWPLPWYLRDYGEVGYWSAVDMNEPLGDIIVFQRPVEADIMTLLSKHELYVRLFKEPMLLRPGVPLEAYVRKSLWDARWSDVDE